MSICFWWDFFYIFLSGSCKDNHEYFNYETRNNEHWKFSFIPFPLAKYAARVLSWYRCLAYLARLLDGLHEGLGSGPGDSSQVRNQFLLKEVVVITLPTACCKSIARFIKSIGKTSMDNRSPIDFRTPRVYFTVMLNQGKRLLQKAGHSHCIPWIAILFVCFTING